MAHPCVMKKMSLWGPLLVSFVLSCLFIGAFSEAVGSASASASGASGASSASGSVFSSGASGASGGGPFFSSGASASRGGVLSERPVSFSVSSEGVLSSSSSSSSSSSAKNHDGGGGSSENPTSLGDAAGYYSLKNTHGGHMFYLFFTSRASNPSSAPLVLWLTGGPGCSSELAVFYENGPYHLEKDASLSINEYGWDQTSNLLYVDQPLDTGFSFSKNPLDIVHNEKGVAADMWEFFQAFLEAHPELKNNDVYVTGESYAGHYVPAVTYKLYEADKAKQGTPVNIKGMAIGNGLTDPLIQYGAYGDFALQNKMIKNSTYNAVQAIVPQCQKMVAKCKSTPPADEQTLLQKNQKGIFSHPCMEAATFCESIPGMILQAAGNVNVYDIRKQCTYPPLCYDFSAADAFLNSPDTQKMLGVSRKWQSCSGVVHSAMMGDWMHDLEPVIPTLLEANIRVLIYAGEDDFICNYLGNQRWVEQMKWSGQDAFNKQPVSTFSVDGDAGQGKEYGGLSFLRVHSAGHMVPMDQPKASLEMLRRFVTGEPMFPPQKANSVLGRKGASTSAAEA